MRAKIWSKYAKDVMNFVEKRTSLEMEWAKNLTRLAQTMRPILKEESYLPFQSIYCTALDQDLEMCATTQVLLTLSTTYQKTPYYEFQKYLTVYLFLVSMFFNILVNLFTSSWV